MRLDAKGRPREPLWLRMLPGQVARKTQCRWKHRTNDRPTADGTGLILGGRSYCILRRWHRGWHRDFWGVEWQGGER